VFVGAVGSAALAEQCPPCLAVSAGGKRSVVSTRVRGAAAMDAHSSRPSRRRDSRHEGTKQWETACLWVQLVRWHWRSSALQCLVLLRQLEGNAPSFPRACGAPAMDAHSSRPSRRRDSRHQGTKQWETACLWVRLVRRYWRSSALQCLAASAGGKRSVVSTRVRGAAALDAHRSRPSRRRIQGTKAPSSGKRRVCGGGWFGGTGGAVPSSVLLRQLEGNAPSFPRACGAQRRGGRRCCARSGCRRCHRGVNPLATRCERSDWVYPRITCGGTGGAVPSSVLLRRLEGNAPSFPRVCGAQCGVAVAFAVAAADVVSTRVPLACGGKAGALGVFLDKF
jgi:hypothetical protein